MKAHIELFVSSRNDELCLYIQFGKIIREILP